MTQLEDEMTSDMYVAQDPFWHLDRTSLTAMQNTFGMRAVESRIEGLLPTPLRHVSVEHCHKYLATLQTEPVMRWAGSSATKQLTITLEALQKIKDCRRDATKSLQSEFGLKVKTACAHFLRHQIASEDKKGTRMLCGMDAAEYLLNDIVMKKSLGGTKNPVTKGEHTKCKAQFFLCYFSNTNFDSRVLC